MHLLRAVSCVVFCCLALAALPSSLAYPQPNQGNYYSDYEPQPDPIELIDMLNRLGNIIQMERKMDKLGTKLPQTGRFGPRSVRSVATLSFYPTKRGLDLGLSRGYSGSLAAKHLMGLAAANFAGGPGRKRRDLTSA